MDVDGMEQERIVVPHAGTWIEIVCHMDHCIFSSPFLTRERGLKYQVPGPALQENLSFPTRERGLKSFWNVLSVLLTSAVIPHVGTWIEITKRKSNGVVHGAFPMREQKPQKPEIAINTCI